MSAVLAAGSLACGAITAPALAQETVTWTEDEANLIAGFEALRTSTPGSALATETSVRALLSNFPDFIAVDIGEIEAEGDGVIFHDISLSMVGEEIPLGVRIGELRAYGLDDGELTKLAAGETAQVADRIDIREISLYGLEDLMQMATDTYVDQLSEALPQPGEDGDIVLDVPEGPDFSINSYDFSIGQLILDGLVWHAAPEGVDEGIVSLFGEDGPPEGKEAWVLFSPLARFYRSFEADTLAYYDANAALNADVNEDGMQQHMEVEFSFPLAASTGISRGDMDLSMSKGVTYLFDMNVAGDELDGADIPLKMSGSADLSIWQDLKLSKLAGYLERQEVPSSDITDLMSFGRGTIYGERSVMGDEEFYTVGKTSIDLSDWHWFIPEVISFKSEDYRLNIGSYLGFIENTMRSVPEVTEDPEAEQMFAMFNSVEDLLAENGLEILDMDIGLNFTWDAESGASSLDMDNDVEKVGAFKLGLGSTTMPYDDARELFLRSVDETSEEPMSGEYFAQAFMMGMAVTDFELMLDDDGGLERAFALAIGISKLIPDEEAEGPVLMLRDSTPDEVRSMVGGLIRMTGFEAASVFPPAVTYINGFADFLMKGGKLSVKMDPEEPIGAANAMQLQGMIADPDAMVEYLGLEFEYTEPEDE
tara:strand:+ start:64480 stop:66429 length:1950 start_codon:yes stop_codon:yes gene_type:complete